jgi:hypothetical protein
MSAALSFFSGGVFAQPSGLAPLPSFQNPIDILFIINYQLSIVN